MDFLKSVLGIGNNIKDFLKDKYNDVTQSAKKIEHKIVPGGIGAGVQRVKNTPLSDFWVLSPNSIRQGARSAQPIIDAAKLVRRIPEDPLSWGDDISRFAGRATETTFRTFQKGMNNLADAPTTFSKPGFWNKAKAVGQTAAGVGQVVAPIMPLFQGANLAASGDQPQPKLISPTPDVPNVQDKDYIRRFSAGILRGMSQIQDLAPDVQKQDTFDVFGTKIDPVEMVGNMIGFVNNPVNKQLFKLTSKFNPQILNNKVANFVLVNGARGAVEDVMLSLPDLPTESRLETLKFLGAQAVFGATSEITVNGAIESPKVFLNKMRQVLQGADKQALEEGMQSASKLLKNSAGKLYDSKTGRFAQKAVEKVKAVGGGYLPQGKIKEIKDGKIIREEAPAQAFGAMAGMEYDDDGRLRINPEKAVAGILMTTAAGRKTAKTGAGEVGEKWGKYLTKELPQKVFRALDSTDKRATLGKGTYVGEALEAVKKYGSKIAEFEIEPGTKLLDLTNPNVLQEFSEEAIQNNKDLFRNLSESGTPDDALAQVMREYAQKLGFDGIRGDEAFGTVVFDAAKLKGIQPQAKFERTYNLANREDYEYLARIFGEDGVEQIKNEGRYRMRNMDEVQKIAKANIINEPVQTTPKSGQEMQQEAIKRWRSTTDPKLGAYITTDGKMIDGSGRVDADRSNWQYMNDWIVDHREIAQSVFDKSGTAAMLDYMNKSGNVRLNVTANEAGFDIIQQPTAQQLKMMEKAAQGKKVSADITRPDGTVVKSGFFNNFQEYKKFLNEYFSKGGHEAPKEEMAGLIAGMEPEYDDEGNITGFQYNPEKGMAGLAVAGVLRGKSLTVKVEKVRQLLNQAETPEQALKYMRNLFDYVKKTGNEDNLQVLKKALNEYKSEFLVTGRGLPRDPVNEPLIDLIDEVAAIPLKDAKGLQPESGLVPFFSGKLSKVTNAADDWTKSFFSGGSGKTPELPEPQTPRLETGNTGGGQLPPGGKTPQSGAGDSMGGTGSTWIQNISNKFNRLYTSTIDRFHPLTSLAKKAGQLDEMDWALAQYYGSGSTANYHINYELSPILKNTNVDDLREAAIAMRDIELSGRGIRGSNLGAFSDGLPDTQGVNQQTKEAMQRLSRLKDKLGVDGMNELDKNLNKLYEYQDKLVKEYLIKTGIMSQKQFDAMKKNNQFYVPYRRVMESVDDFLGMTPQNKGAGSVASQNVIKGIKGSEKAIEDPIESIVENTYKILNVARRQQVAQNIVNLKDKLPVGMITRIKGKVGQKPNIALFENGKVRHYSAPADVVEAAKGMREETLNKVVEALSIPTAWFRATATGANPEFLIPNAFRDLQGAFVNAGLNPLAFARGMAHMMKQDEVWQEFLKSGAQTSRVALDRPYLKQTVGDITKKGLGVKTPKDVLRVFQALGEFSEQPTRVAVWEDAYKKAIKKGLSIENAQKAAAKAAQDTTTNFARRGADTKSFNAIYAFVNARMQGTDKLIRSFKDDPVGVGTRLGIMTIAPTVVSYIHNNRFESYNDDRVISERDKRDNFIIMLSDEPIEALGGAQYLKIPKGDIGKLGNPIEAYLDFALNKGGDIGKSVVETLLAFAPIDNVGDTIPTSLQPPIEVAFNKDFYTGYDLVPDYKKNFPGGLQDNSFTSPLFRMIGQKLNISPAKMQQFVQGYGTGWVRIADMLTSKLVPEQYHTEKNDQSAPINTTPVIRRFFGGEKMPLEAKLKSDKTKTETLNREISTIRNAIKKGDIPQEAGMKQIEKLQKDLGKVGQGRAGGDNLDALAQVYELDQYIGESTKTGINKLEDQKKRAKEAVKLFDGDGGYAAFPEDQKEAMIERMGYSKPDIEYASLASKDTEIKAEYIMDQDLDHDELIDSLVKGRVPSVTGDLYASNGVLDDLYEAGVITSAERTWLKKVKLNPDGSTKQGSAGSGSGVPKSVKNKISKSLDALFEGATKTPELPKATKPKKGTEVNFANFFKQSNQVDTGFKTKVTQPQATPMAQFFAANRKKVGVNPKAYAEVSKVRGRAGGSSTPTKLSRSSYRPSSA